MAVSPRREWVTRVISCLPASHPKELALSLGVGDSGEDLHHLPLWPMSPLLLKDSGGSEESSAPEPSKGDLSIKNLYHIGGW